jgi:multiple antibiotic resistance protein
MELTLWSALVMLLVTIGPVEAALLFAGLTRRESRAERRALAIRSVLIAGTMLLLFAAAGPLVLGLLGVSMPAFQVAGGLLLFLQALSLIFAKSGSSSLSEAEQREAESLPNMAVVPLAFPVIAGPASLSAIILLIGRAASWQGQAGVIAMLLLCLALTLGLMLLAERLTRLLGRTGADVVGRVSGILLAALAVQFVFDGLKGAAAAGIFPV